MGDELLELLQGNYKDIEQRVLTLEVEKISTLIDLLGSNSLNEEKKGALLTGIHESKFLYLLEKHFTFFKACAHLEALQHKLALVANQMDQILKEVLSFLEKGEELLIQLKAPLFSNISEAIESKREILSSTERHIKRLIELTWLSERVDLIDIFSELNERCKHLKIRLKAFEGDFKNRAKEKFELSSDALAIEGLVAMGLTYPGDWKNFLKKVGEEAHDPREIELIEQTSRLLANAGLFTVKNLEERGLFTLENVISFLKELR